MAAATCFKLSSLMVLARMAYLRGNPAIQLAATKPPGAAQLESRYLPLLGQPVNGLLPCLEVDRHFVQRENFAIGLIHVRRLAWCRAAKFSKVWSSLPFNHLRSLASHWPELRRERDFGYLYEGALGRIA